MQYKERDPRELLLMAVFATLISAARRAENAVPALEEYIDAIFPLYIQQGAHQE